LRHDKEQGRVANTPVVPTYGRNINIGYFKESLAWKKNKNGSQELRILWTIRPRPPRRFFIECLISDSRFSSCARPNLLGSTALSESSLPDSLRATHWPLAETPPANHRERRGTSSHICFKRGLRMLYRHKWRNKVVFNLKTSGEQNGRVFAHFGKCRTSESPASHSLAASQEASSLMTQQCLILNRSSACVATVCCSGPEFASERLPHNCHRLGMDETFNNHLTCKYDATSSSLSLIGVNIVSLRFCFIRNNTLCEFRLILTTPYTNACKVSEYLSNLNTSLPHRTLGIYVKLFKTKAIH